MSIVHNIDDNQQTALSGRRNFFEVLGRPFSRVRDTFNSIDDAVDTTLGETTLVDGLHAYAERAISAGESVQEYLQSLKPIIDRLPNPTRREFFKIAELAGLTAGMLFLNNCGLSKEYIKRDNELVRNTKWDSNPIIPVPRDGCYSGFYNAMRDDPSIADMIVDRYLAFAKKIPTIMQVGTFDVSAYNEIFPKYSCEALVERGITPLIKYAVLPPDFDDIANGKYDKEISLFAKQIKEFKYPIFLVPFQEINCGAQNPIWGKAYNEGLWGGSNPRKFKKAWKHIHKIFEGIGANKNTLWTPHFIDNTVSAQADNYKSFYPGEEYVDWIGFTVQAANFVNTTGSSFDSLFSSTYKEVRKDHPYKPIIIIELASQANSSQPRWVKNTFTSIKNKFPAIKAFIWHNSGMAGGLSGVYGSKEAYSQAISDSYFIGSILKK